MELDRPEGCQAAVTSGWEYIHGNHKLTVNLVCGDRQNSCSDSFPRPFMEMGSEFKAQQAEAKVSEQVTEVLGAMCLGCPHNTKNVQGGN
jgi:hypothetical protein